MTGRTLLAVKSEKDDWMEGCVNRQEWQDRRDTKEKNDRMDVKAAKRADMVTGKAKKRWQDGRLDGSSAKRMTGSM